MIPGSGLRLWSFLLNLHRSALSTTQNDHNQLTCKKEEKEFRIFLAGAQNTTSTRPTWPEMTVAMDGQGEGSRSGE
jgi:hypothetical protein